MAGKTGLSTNPKHKNPMYRDLGRAFESINHLKGKLESTERKLKLSIGCPETELQDFEPVECSPTKRKRKVLRLSSYHLTGRIDSSEIVNGHSAPHRILDKRDFGVSSHLKLSSADSKSRDAVNGGHLGGSHLITTNGFATARTRSMWSVSEPKTNLTASERRPSLHLNVDEFVKFRRDVQREREEEEEAAAAKIDKYDRGRNLNGRPPALLPPESSSSVTSDDTPRFKPARRDTDVRPSTAPTRKSVAIQAPDSPPTSDRLPVWESLSNGGAGARALSGGGRAGTRKPPAASRALPPRGVAAQLAWVPFEKDGDDVAQSVPGVSSLSVESRSRKVKDVDTKKLENLLRVKESIFPSPGGAHIRSSVKSQLDLSKLSKTENLKNVQSGSGHFAASVQPRRQSSTERLKSDNRNADAVTTKSKKPVKQKRVRCDAEKIQEAVINPFSWRRGLKRVKKKFHPATENHSSHEVDKLNKRIADIDCDDHPSSEETQTSKSSHKEVESDKPWTAPDADIADSMPTRDVEFEEDKAAKDINAVRSTKPKTASPKKKTRPATSRKLASSSPNDLALSGTRAKPAAKVRHYDQDTVQKYIQKQKEERRLKVKMEQTDRQAMREEKRKKLHDLELRQRAIPKSSGDGNATSDGRPQRQSSTSFLQHPAQPRIVLSDKRPVFLVRPEDNEDDAKDDFAWKKLVYPSAEEAERYLVEMKLLKEKLSAYDSPTDSSQPDSPPVPQSTQSDRRDSNKPVPSAEPDNSAVTRLSQNEFLKKGVDVPHSNVNERLRSLSLMCSSANEMLKQIDGRTLSNAIHNEGDSRIKKLKSLREQALALDESISAETLKLQLRLKSQLQTGLSLSNDRNDEDKLAQPEKNGGYSGVNNFTEYVANERENIVQANENLKVNESELSRLDESIESLETSPLPSHMIHPLEVRQQLINDAAIAQARVSTSSQSFGASVANLSELAVSHSQTVENSQPAATTIESALRSLIPPAQVDPYNFFNILSRRLTDMAQRDLEEDARVHVRTGGSRGVGLPGTVEQKSRNAGFDNSNSGVQSDKPTRQTNVVEKVQPQISSNDRKSPTHITADSRRSSRATDGASRQLDDASSSKLNTSSDLVTFKNRVTPPAQSDHHERIEEVDLTAADSSASLSQHSMSLSVDIQEQISEGPLTPESDVSLVSLVSRQLPQATGSRSGSVISVGANNSDTLSGQQSLMSDQQISAAVDDDSSKALIIGSDAPNNSDLQTNDNVASLQDRNSSNLKMSPNTLRLRLSTELNYLDNVQDSLGQLQNMERIREVTLAQQESVALSQVIQAKRWNEAPLRDPNQQGCINSENVARISAEAARQLGETMIRHNDTKTVETIAAATAGAVTAAIAQLKDRLFPSRSVTSASKSTSPSSSPSGNLESTITTKSRSSSSLTSDSSSQKSSHSQDRHAGGDHTSIQTVSDAGSQQPSGSWRQSGSSNSFKNFIPEEMSLGPPVPQASSTGYEVTEVKDDKDLHSLTEGPITEEEIDEKSFRMVLPSESHRRSSATGRLSRADSPFSDISKRGSVSDAVSISSQDDCISVNSAGAAQLEDLSLFSGENSLRKFTVTMVRQYIEEEEMRSRHQNAILNLREQAVLEKTRAELAWLEMQKKRCQLKGRDEKMPPLQKRQKNLLQRLKQEKAEIKRLRDAEVVARQERQLILKQQQQVTKLQQSTQIILSKIKEATPGKNDVVTMPDRAGTSPSQESPFERTAKGGLKSNAVKASSMEDLSSTAAASPGLEQSRRLSATSATSQVLQGLRKLQISKRYLTKREQKLLQRRKNVEELLRWQEKLDDEELNIQEMERQALHRLSDKRAAGAIELPATETITGAQKMGDTIEEANVSEEVSTRSSNHQKRSDSDAVIEEILPDKSASISEDISKVLSTVSDQNRESGSHVVSGDGDSVSTVPNYSDETFEGHSKTRLSADAADEVGSSVIHSVTKVSDPTESSVIRARSMVLRSPLTPSRTHARKRRDSSGSEDSCTISQSETASELSDIESRIHALKEDLRHRRGQVEKLKHEQKRKNKERLKAQEAALLKQIEAYDRFIVQVQLDLQRELEQDYTTKAPVKPVIKQPRVAESKRLQRQASLDKSPEPEERRLQSICSSVSQGAEAQKGDTLWWEKDLSPTQNVPPSISQPVSLENSESSYESRQVSEIDSSKIEELISSSNETVKNSLSFRETSGDGPPGDENAVDLPASSSTKIPVSTVGHGGDSLPLEHLENSELELSFNDEVSEERQDTDKSVQSSILETVPYSAKSLRDQGYHITTDDGNNLASDKNDCGAEEILLSSEQPLPTSLVAEITTNKTQPVVSEKSFQSTGGVSVETFNESHGLGSQFVLPIDDEEGGRLNSEGKPQEVKTSTPAEVTTVTTLISPNTDDSKKIVSLVDDITNTLLHRLMSEVSTQSFRKSSSAGYKTQASVVSESSPRATSPSDQVDRVDHITDVILNNLVNDSVALILDFRGSFIVDAESSPSNADNKLFQKKVNCVPGSVVTVSRNEGYESSVSQRVSDILAEFEEKKSPISKTRPQDLLVLSFSNTDPELENSPQDSPVKTGPGSPVPRPSSPVLGQSNELSQFELAARLTALQSRDETYNPQSGRRDEDDDDCEWFDEDFGLGGGISPSSPSPYHSPSSSLDEGVQYCQLYPYQNYFYIREIPNKPPPPYTPPGQSPATGASPPETTNTLAGFSSADFRRLTTERFHQLAINYDAEELNRLVTLATEHHVQRLLLSDPRRSETNTSDGVERPNAETVSPGERANELDGRSPEAPSSFYTPEDLMEQDICSRSRRVYKKFILDLVGETVAAYHQTRQPQPRPPYMKIEWPSSAVLKRVPGTTREELTARVQQLVTKHLETKSSLTFGSMPATARDSQHPPRWAANKKRDFVDDILLRELQQEEAEWVNYDRDEVDVKMQLCDSVFDAVLVETIQLAKDVFSRRYENGGGPGDVLANY